MSTSGTTQFTVTTNDIVVQTLKNTGKLGIGDPIDPEEYSDCVTMLNLMCKQWIAKNDFAPGLKMWTRQRGYMFLSTVTGTYTLGSQGGTGASYWTNQFLTTNSAGSNASGATTINLATTTAAQLNMQSSINSQTGALVAGQVIGIQLDSGNLFWTTIVTVPTSTTVTVANGLPSSSNNIGNVVYAFTSIAPPPQVIEGIMLRDNTGNDTKVEPLNLEDWLALPSKQSPDYTGDPVAVYYEPKLVGNSGQGYGIIHTDVAGAQDVSKYLVISYLREIQDFVNPGDEMDFPKEWGMALIYGLGKHICKRYNIDWTQVDEENSIASIRFARNANNKTTTRGFQPGNMGQMTTQPWR